MRSSLPQDTIIYNLEQLSPGYPWFQAYYLDLLGRFRAWDYNARTVNYLRRAGIARNVEHVPIGYAQCWTRIAKVRSRMLMSCSMAFVQKYPPAAQISASRRRCRPERWRAEQRVGKWRPKWSQIQGGSQMHEADTGTFEVVRAIFLMASRKTVVCECANPDEVDADLRPGIAMAGSAAMWLSGVSSSVRSSSTDDRRCGFIAVNAPELQMAHNSEKHQGCQMEHRPVVLRRKGGTTNRICLCVSGRL